MRKMPSSKQRHRPRPVVERWSMIEKFEFEKTIESFCQGGSRLDKQKTTVKRRALSRMLPDQSTKFIVLQRNRFKNQQEDVQLRDKIHDSDRERKENL
jgi:hypothetical protein